MYRWYSIDQQTLQNSSYQITHFIVALYVAKYEKLRKDLFKMKVTTIATEWEFIGLTPVNYLDIVSWIFNMSPKNTKLSYE